ncbi:ATP-dependent helicase HrpB [Pseudoalteromonas sp. T1lg65]|uniref:ATP-dependent helicase HrpB n=1 Tax=Pseudoalteromonas sp. T1lg65 TaxID=2077101 RepID=UPI003F7A4915
MLPIQQVYSDLVQQLTTQPTVLLQAPPGAGKSTWLPLQLILDGHFNKIVMLEPRRIAARNIAQFLASQLQEEVGHTVGVRMRQEVNVSAQTRLEVVTEGMLTRMIQADPELAGVDLLIFDEFHERSLAADTALAFALESQAALREDLRILVMSATLDGARYQQFLQCHLIASQGQSYPVETIYQPLAKKSEWLEAIPNLILRALSEQQGSVLVFLPGKREIQQVANSLSNLPNNVILTSLYGEQDKQLQQQSIAPAAKGTRKVVLTTNIAETSLTIEGIRVVIDSGKRRAAQFNLKTGVTELVTVAISKSSAIQRAGRAGRLAPGVVYRQGSQAEFDRLAEHDIPEILSSDISSLVLEAKMWGSEVALLPLLDVPSTAQLQQANELLKMLEALDEQYKLTKFAASMQRFGTEPRLAHMLLKAQKLESSHPGITELACYFLAWLDARIKGSAELSVAIQSQYQRPHPVFKKQLQYWLKKSSARLQADLTIEYLPLIVALAFPDRLAKRRGQGFVCANGAGVNAHPEHWLDAEYLAIASLGGHNGQTIFSATAFSPIEIESELPHLFTDLTICEFDERSQRFVHEDRTYLGHWVVSSKPSSKTIDISARTQAWVSLVTHKGLNIFHDYNDCEQLLIRFQLAAKYEQGVYQDFTQTQLMGELKTWLGPYLHEVKTVEQLRKVSLREALTAAIDWSVQQTLNTLLPQKITVPSGSSIKVQYQLEGPAKLSVRMQEVFGLTETPRLCNGKLGLLMELLSPAQRPLQLTQDLAHFWQSSYREVQKEMKGRYPKHFWPDNPAQATATNKVKSRM